MILTVNSRDLKEAFEEISPIIRKTDMSNSVLFDYAKDKLTLSIDAGIRYEKTIDIVNRKNAVSTSLVVWFSDISELLKSTGTVDIHFDKFGVDIRTADLDTSLNISEALISKYKIPDGIVRSVDTAKLCKAIKKLSSVNTIAKSMQVVRPLLLDGDYAYIKYLTFWVKVESSVIESSITIENARIILNFEPSTVEISDVLVFRKDNTLLAVPNMKLISDNQFDEIANQMEKINTLSVEGVLTACQKLNKVIPNSVANVTIYRSGIKLTLKSAKSVVTRVFGEADEVLTNFQLHIEYLVQIFSLLESGTVDLYRKDYTICLKSSTIEIITSVE